MSKGYDLDDSKLSSSELKNKYQGEVLERKAIDFCNLKIQEQKDTLITSITGEETEASKKKDEAPQHVMAILRVKMFLASLSEIGKKEEWLTITEYHSFKYFMKLSVEGKSQYHNDLQKYHDEEMKKNKKEPPKPNDQVFGSPPTDQGGFPDFDDPAKWEKQ